VGILKKDPDQLKKQIENLEMMSKSCFCFSMAGCKMQYSFFHLSLLLLLWQNEYWALIKDCLIEHLVAVVWMNLLVCVNVRTHFRGVGTTVEISVSLK